MTVFFYLFTSVLLGSSMAVILSRNQVHSLLWLILAFLNGAGLFLLLGAELLAFLLIIVYVGAVAVLFLFVVMMLDIKPPSPQQKLTLRSGITWLIMVIFVGEVSFYVWSLNKPLGFTEQALGANNAQQLGEVLYTHYFLPFELAGLILLVAMIGAIVLTLRPYSNTKRQNVHQQLEPSSGNKLQLCKVPFRTGVKLP